MIKYGDAQLDTARQVLKLGERGIVLTPTETQLLAALMRHPGQAHSMRALAETVWNVEPSDKFPIIVRNVVFGLRRRLQSLDPSFTITSIRGIGYRLEPTRLTIPAQVDNSERVENSVAIEVLVSYSHRDERYRQQLEIHLSLLQRQKLLSVWHDRRIGAGTEWKGQIDAHLESAELILLLVSPDFLASDYCYDVELKRALERHEAGTARVIPIILRSVDWHDAPFGKLQALPKDGKPISTWANRDEAFRGVVAGIRRAVQELRTNKPAPVATHVELTNERQLDALVTHIAYEENWTVGEVDQFRQFLQSSFLKIRDDSRNQPTRAQVQDLMNEFRRLRGTPRGDGLKLSHHESGLEITPSLDPIGGLETPLVLGEEQREKEGEAWNQPRGKGRIINFHVSSFDQHTATVEWSTNASMDVRLSLFRKGSETPDQTVTVPSVGLPGQTQAKTFPGLQPKTYYRIDAVCDDDRQSELVETLEEWMR